jgi:hypothetical protein
MHTPIIVAFTQTFSHRYPRKYLPTMALNSVGLELAKQDIVCLAILELVLCVVQCRPDNMDPYTTCL